jgi:hypothetical protein
MRSSTGGMPASSNFGEEFIATDYYSSFDVGPHIVCRERRVLGRRAAGARHAPRPCVCSCR